ncbi:MAG TPA: diaminopimelate decarboxylase [Dehalococcoidia bacterium]|nr:diaminopimelate decarboxylase [Dehalococcoidia bacterium]
MPLRNILPITAQVDSQGHLSIGGCDCVELAREFGTPLYVFDEATLRHQCRSFVQEFRRRTETTVLYAAKAYIGRALAAILAEEGLGLDVVSGGELAVARSAGFPPERIYFHGNNKSAGELGEALDYGVGRIVVDNLREMETLSAIARERAKRQPALLRLSPGIDPHTHAHTTTGVLDSKFGFPMATGQAEKALAAALALPGLEVVGLHVHLGSPIFEMEPYREASWAVAAFAATARDRYGFRWQEFSPGGGFAVQYVEEQPAPAPAQYAEAIVSSLTEACASHGLPLPRLVVEPGRATVGRAGVALYTVGSRKEIPGVRRYVFVDGGMADNIRPALYGALYRALVANKANIASEERVTIAGKYCESGDILIRDIDLPRLESGDIIAIPAAGAYCLAMASNYNLALRPAVVLVADGKARLIRRRESYEDLLQLEVFDG